MAKSHEPSLFSIIVAAVFVALGLLFLAVAFFSGHVTPIQYTILVWVFGPIIAIVSGVYTGRLVVKDSKIGRALVTATGGFAVWLLFFWFIPLPNEVVVTILLYRNGQPVRENRQVTIEYANDSRTDTAVNGKINFRLP